MSKMHVGDIGTQFECTINDECGNIVNIASYTSIVFTFQRPDGSTLTTYGSLYTNGTDGIVTYTTQNGDISLPGIWSLQIQVNFAAQTYSTNVYTFYVENNL